MITKEFLKILESYNKKEEALKAILEVTNSGFMFASGKVWFTLKTIQEIATGALEDNNE